MGISFAGWMKDYKTTDVQKINYRTRRCDTIDSLLTESPDATGTIHTDFYGAESQEF